MDSTFIAYSLYPRTQALICIIYGFRGTQVAKNCNNIQLICNTHYLRELQVQYDYVSCVLYLTQLLLLASLSFYTYIEELSGAWGQA